MDIKVISGGLVRNELMASLSYNILINLTGEIVTV